MKLLLATACVFALAACSEAPTEPAATPVETPAAAETPPEPSAPPAADASDECGASAYAGLVGKSLTDPTVPAASPDLRHIKPGDAVTEDYRVERMNIYATETGVIEKITCG